jgi:hypothetical protein
MNILINSRKEITSVNTFNSLYRINYLYTTFLASERLHFPTRPNPDKQKGQVRGQK